MSAAAFFTGLLALCGQAFEGRMTTNDPADAAMGAQRDMPVREFCERVLAAHQKG